MKYNHVMEFKGPREKGRYNGVVCEQSLRLHSDGLNPPPRAIPFQMISSEVLLRGLHGLGQKEKLIVSHEVEIPARPGDGTKVIGWSGSRRGLR